MPTICLILALLAPGALALWRRNSPVSNFFLGVVASWTGLCYYLYFRREDYLVYLRGIGMGTDENMIWSYPFWDHYTGIVIGWLPSSIYVSIVLLIAHRFLPRETRPGKSGQ